MRWDDICSNFLCPPNFWGFSTLTAHLYCWEEMPSFMCVCPTRARARLLEACSCNRNSTCRYAQVLKVAENFEGGFILWTFHRILNTKREEKQ